MAQTPSLQLNVTSESRRRSAAIEAELVWMARGILAQLADGKMSPADACRAVFNMDNYREIKRHRLDRRVRELWEWGMELEDVADLAPIAIDQSLAKMIELCNDLLQTTGKGSKVHLRVANA